MSPLRSVVGYARLVLSCGKPSGNAGNSLNNQVKMAVMGNALTTIKRVLQLGWSDLRKTVTSDA
jgi:hypothetical protein